VPALHSALVGRDLDVAVTSGWSLARISPTDDQVVGQVLPILLKGLRSTEVSTRIEAAEALGALGSRAASAAEALRAAQNDDSERVRTAATSALESIGK
jgi:HEAT repeat protein